MIWVSVLDNSGFSDLGDLALKDLVDPGDRRRMNSVMNKMGELQATHLNLLLLHNMYKPLITGMTGHPRRR